MTTVWPEDCYWISDLVCYEVSGTYNTTVQKTTDTCFPCASSSYGCQASSSYGPDGDALFFCGQAQNKFPADFYSTDYCPGECVFVGNASIPPYTPPYTPPTRKRRLASVRALQQERPGSSNPFAEGGTRAFEGYAGTLALPNNNVSTCRSRQVGAVASDKCRSPAAEPAQCMRACSRQLAHACWLLLQCMHRRNALNWACFTCYIS
jgi:hypothetical protein